MTWTSLAAASALFLAAPGSRELPRVDPTVKPLETCRPALVSFRDEQEGLLSSFCGELLRTHDGGRSWQRDAALEDVLLPGGRDAMQATSYLSHLAWIGPRTAVAIVAHGKWLFRTEDGGSTWQRVALPLAPERPLRFTMGGIEGSSDLVLDAAGQRLWICNDSERLLRSDDGGRSWKALAGTPFDPEDTCQVLSFVTTQDGWAGGRSGRLWRTADGGETWEPLSSPDGIPPKLDPAVNLAWQPWKGLQRVNARLAWGWTVGGRYRTRDGGRSWERHSEPTAAQLAPVVVRVGARLPWIAQRGTRGETSPELLVPLFERSLVPWGDHGVVSSDLRLTYYRNGKQVRLAPLLSPGSSPPVPLEGRVRGASASWGWVGKQVLTTLDDDSWYAVGELPLPVQRLTLRDADILLARIQDEGLYRSDDWGENWSRTSSPLDAWDYARATGAQPPALLMPECVLASSPAVLRVHIRGRGELGGGWQSDFTLRFEQDSVRLEVEEGVGEKKRVEAVVARARTRRAVLSLIAAARRRGYPYECGIGSESEATLSWTCGATARETQVHETDHCGGAGGLFYRRKNSSWPIKEPDPREEGIPQAAQRIAQELMPRQ